MDRDRFRYAPEKWSRAPTAARACPTAGQDAKAGAGRSFVPAKVSIATPRVTCIATLDEYGEDLARIYTSVGIKDARMTRARIFLGTSPRVLSSEDVAGEPPLRDGATPLVSSSRRRQIPWSSGRALEVLSHAIEYLADEYVLRAGSVPSLYSEDPQVRAIQVLMAASRSVYWNCPVAPTLRERLTKVWRVICSLTMRKHNRVIKIRK